MAGNDYLSERFRGIDRRIDAIEGEQASMRDLIAEVHDSQIEASAERRVNNRLSWGIFWLVVSILVGNILAYWLHFPASR